MVESPYSYMRIMRMTSLIMRCYLTCLAKAAALASRLQTVLHCGTCSNGCSR
jgi:hypothetical protein